MRGIHTCCWVRCSGRDAVFVVEEVEGHQVEELKPCCKAGCEYCKVLAQLPTYLPGAKRISLKSEADSLYLGTSMHRLL